jgi:hypothetical protein
MKNTLFLAFALCASMFVSCDKDDDKPNNPESVVVEKYINATSQTDWHYYSFAKGELVGSAAESVENSAIWGARTDWDIAIQRYKIRTNSGQFTTVGAQGGVYLFDTNLADTFGNITPATKFESVAKLPSGVEFAVDGLLPTDKPGGGSVDVIRAKPQVVQIWSNGQTPTGPPDYRPSPVMIFRTADGKSYYKVEFTAYKNDQDTSGHVTFSLAQIY